MWHEDILSRQLQYALYGLGTPSPSSTLADARNIGSRTGHLNGATLDKVCSDPSHNLNSACMFDGHHSVVRHFLEAISIGETSLGALLLPGIYASFLFAALCALRDPPLHHRRLTRIELVLSTHPTLGITFHYIPFPSSHLPGR